MLYKSFLLSILAIVTVGIFAIATPLFAQGSSAGTAEVINSQLVGQVKKDTGLGNRSPIEITALIIGAFLSILGVISFVIFVYAGFRWMTAAGREAEVNKAKEMMKQAIIGFVIIMASYSIARYVFSIIEGATGQGRIPQATLYQQEQIRKS